MKPRLPYLVPNLAAIVLLVAVAGWRVAAFHPLFEAFHPAPLEDLATLKGVPVPLPPDLDRYVVDRAAAVQLGKAFFWEMQAGSDGIQACASCHFNAGADSRTKNQLSPAGAAGTDVIFSFGGPNYDLKAGDFPIGRDANEVVSSQGVLHAKFVAIASGTAEDQVAPLADPVFHVTGVRTRRVEPRNTPTPSTPPSTIATSGTAAPTTSSTE